MFKLGATPKKAPLATPKKNDLVRFLFGVAKAAQKDRFDAEKKKQALRWWNTLQAISRRSSEIIESLWKYC